MRFILIVVFIVPVKRYGKDRRKYLCIHNGICMNDKGKVHSLAVETTSVQAPKRSPATPPSSADRVIFIITNSSNGKRRNNTSNEEHWS